MIHGRRGLCVEGRSSRQRLAAAELHGLCQCINKIVAELSTADIRSDDSYNSDGVGDIHSFFNSVADYVRNLLRQMVQGASSFNQHPAISPLSFVLRRFELSSIGNFGFKSSMRY
jgi:hypothetical protein